MKCNYEFPSIPESGVIAYIEGEIVRIFFNITPAAIAPPMDGAEEDENGDNQPSSVQTYDCEQVDVIGGRDYADIVSAIVNERYSPDDVQAIFANYTEVNNTSPLVKIAVEKQDEYLNEYSAFQEWRRLAKKVAEETIKIIA